MIPSISFINFLSCQYNFDSDDEYDKYLTSRYNGVGKKSVNETVDAVLVDIGKIMNVFPEEIKGKSRKEPLVLIRHMAAYICYKNNIGSLKLIGRAFGGRDHATIINSLARTKDMVQVRDADFMPIFNKLKHLLK